MEPQKLVDALKRRGHTIGRSAISHDGCLLLNVDNRMMKCADAKELLMGDRESTERKVIEILVGSGVTSDAWGDPIRKVERAMEWPTAETVQFIRDLMDRNLIQPMPIAQMGPTWYPKFEWKEGQLTSMRVVPRA